MEGFRLGFGWWVRVGGIGGIRYGYDYSHFHLEKKNPHKRLRARLYFRFVAALSDISPLLPVYLAACEGLVGSWNCNTF